MCKAIQREFKEERVGLPDGIKISMKHIKAYVESISDEAGRIPVDLEAEAIHTDDAVQDSVLESGNRVPWCTNTGKSLIPLTLLFFAQKRNLLIPLELSRVMHQGNIMVH